MAVVSEVRAMNLWEMAEFSPDHVVEKSIASTDSIEVELYCFEPGQVMDMYSDEADQVAMVLQGEITLLTDGMEHPMTMGHAVLIPADTMHGYRNHSSQRAIVYHVSAPCF